MYYLQSRYYNPTVGRWLNSDDPEYAINQHGSTKHNLLAYCDNDSINHFDKDGRYSLKIHEPSKAKTIKRNIICYTSKIKTLVNTFIHFSSIAKTIVNGILRRYRPILKLNKSQIMPGIKAAFSDVSKWLRNNLKKLNKWLKTNIQITTYRGVPVVVLERMGYSAFSCGIIFIGRTLYNDYVTMDRGKKRLYRDVTLDHEYGHCMQLLLVGLPTFIVFYAIPSLFCYWTNMPDDLYYSMPWEYTADMLGGAKRGYTYSNDASGKGWTYMALSVILSILLAILIA